MSSWDWRRLPGITADVDAPMLPCNYSDRLRADSDLMNATGTVSDGIAGLSALHLVSANATAHKVSVVHAQMYLRKLAACLACFLFLSVYNHCVPTCGNTV